MDRMRIQLVNRGIDFSTFHHMTFESHIIITSNENLCKVHVKRNIFTLKCGAIDTLKMVQLVVKLFIDL